MAQNDNQQQENRAFKKEDVLLQLIGVYCR